ncbi:MAG TPA: NERD domain-containing protein [Candidatus Limnocylindria bacterium]
MRVIRPDALLTDPRRRPRRVALAMMGVGAISILLAFIGPASPVRVGLLACTAAIGIGVGAAWMLRVIAPDHARRRADALIGLLAGIFGDDYTLIVQPRLPVRDLARLDAILVGPGGTRVITVREWHGRYRIHGKTWEYDTHSRHGWIRCRTNPSTDATALTFAVQRWVEEMALPEIHLRAAIVFPHPHSRVVLEEPSDEVVTTDNAPWWANAYGRVLRLNQAAAARVVEAILDAAEPGEEVGFRPLADRGP